MQTVPLIHERVRYLSASRGEKYVCRDGRRERWYGGLRLISVKGWTLSVRLIRVHVHVRYVATLKGEGSTWYAVLWRR